MSVSDKKGKIRPLNEGLATEETLQAVLATSEGYISANNSTSNPLGISGVFTGVWEDTINYSELIASVSSDEDSAINGCVIQWSSDGIVVDEDDKFSIYANKMDGGILYPWLIKYRAYCFGGSNVFPFNIPFKIPEKTDIEVRVITPSAAGTTSAGATFEGWYELNN